MALEVETRRRVKNSKPEAGLAEWTNRIKALQRDVDMDEEVEQRKLEDEIRASRLARARRSGGGQFAERVPLNTVPDENDAASTPADAFRKLTSESSRSPEPGFTSSPPQAMDRKPSTAPAPAPSSGTFGTKSETVSLAAFIGGRATGPRLNRPAPQPDAHDPTLFEQRTRADIVAPHPVFGSRGVALVGLAAKAKEVVDSEARVPDRSTQVKEQFQTGKPTSVKAAVSASTNTNAIGGNTGHARTWSRERTVSSPSPYVPPKPVEKSPPAVIPTGSPGVKGRVESLYAHVNRSVERVSSPPALRGSKSTDKMSQKPAAPAKPDALRKSQPTNDSPLRSTPATSLSASTTTPPPRVQQSNSSSPTRPTSASPSSVPSLARPVQPQQRPLSTGPQIPLSKNPAPAFLKPAQQKDLTPSLSRLQGRGFVQSFVKLSSELEAASGTAGGAGNGSPERTATPKKTSVLDRWNPPNASPSSSPVSAPPLRKARTFDSPRTVQCEISASPAPEPVRLTPQLKSRSLASSVPTKAKSVPAPGDVLPLGSSNTLISYMKPTKTGDSPATDVPEKPHSRPKTPTRHADEKGHGIDELGAGPRSRNSHSNAGSSPSPVKAALRPKSDLGSPVQSGRPLSHPTKDRAKVRRRNAGGQNTSDSNGYVSSESTLKAPTIQESSSENPVRTQTVLPVNKGAPSVGMTPAVATVSSTPQCEVGSAEARSENIRPNQPPIGIKPLRKPVLASPSPTRSSFSAPHIVPKVGKVALPGLATGDSPPSPPLTPPLNISARQERESAPMSPSRHGRSPSNGSRATVMDIAQALGGAPTSPIVPKSPVVPKSPRNQTAHVNEGDERVRDPGVWGGAQNERTITPALLKAERRRSTYEKYASFTLPVLPEEKTPVSSPAGTLKKGPDIASDSIVSNAKVEMSEVRAEKPVPPKKSDFARVPSNSKIHFDVSDDPVPTINVAKIWEAASPSRFVPDPDVHTVSVEVLDVAGGSAILIAKGADNVYVFYETESLVVVHRAKSRSSGLVATKVWAWTGQKAELGEREERKMQDLAKRYGTGLMRRGQYAEPQDLVHVLGGSLITRQGKRSLWSSENTTMHIVRSQAGVTIIDELGLNVKNLCSGFSYCISLLDTLWIWYGCGSVASERTAALRYAQTLQLNSPEKSVVEVEEGKEDEMFWMFLGEDGYASADYWKWRKAEKAVDPRFWRIDCSSTGSEVKELETFPPPAGVGNSVLVAHLAYEIFTLVGSGARGQRRNIKLGLTFAQELSTHTARSKPFRPPVHVLIFPSQIPLDLRAAARGLDSEAIHGSEDIPDHMNLLTLSDAWKQLQQKEWNERELEDGNMMPLGLTPH